MNNLPNADNLPGIGTLQVNGLSFAAGAGAFTLTGNRILSNGPITNLSGVLQTIDLPIWVNAAQTWDGGAAGLTINPSGASFRMRNDGNNLTLARNVTVAMLDFEHDTASRTYRVEILGGSTVSGGAGLGMKAGDAATLDIRGERSSWQMQDAEDLRGGVLGGAGSATVNLGPGAKVIGDQGALQTLGRDATGVGVLNIEGSWWSHLGLPAEFVVGDAGRGELTLLGSGRFSERHSALVLANQAGSVGRFTHASESTASFASALIGLNGTGVLNMTNPRARLDSDAASVGGSAPLPGSPFYNTGDGTVTVTDSFRFSPTSPRDWGWFVAGELTLAFSGSGTLNVLDGGYVESGSTRMGVLPDATATATLAGRNIQYAPSGWKNTGLLEVGVLGSATLNIQDGGEVVTGSLRVGDRGVINLQGGRLALDSFSSVASGARFNWSSGTLAITGAAGANLGSGLLAPGLTLAAGQALEVTQALQVGAGQRLTLQGGSLSTGRLVLAGGSLWMRSGADFAGAFEWTSGTLQFTDTGSASLSSPRFNDALTLATGQALRAPNGLTLGTGSRLTLAGGTFSGGTVTLSGGQLVVGDRNPDITGLAWTAGTLQMTAASGAALNTPLLRRNLILSSGMALKVDTALTLPVLSSLHVASGGALSAGSVNLSGGRLSAADVLDLGRVSPTVSGFGRIDATRVYLPEGATLVAKGGLLTVGHDTRSDGFVADGTLVVEGDGRALLLDADQAQLGRLTRIAGGGRLESAFGMQLLAGRVLSYEGEASIGSDFVNDGTVGPLGAGPGSLRFSDDISGTGSFSGDIIFEGSYSPGPGAASVPFGHGTARFDTGSTLTMEILGGAPGAQFDQLLDLGLLSFDGTLNLVFGTGFVPIAGQQLALFDFDSFSGRLGAADITVTGFDRELLDFSRLAVDGTLTVTSVPEPGTWATLCAGLLAVGGVLNRRRRVE